MYQWRIQGGSGGSIEPSNFSPIKIFEFSIFLCAGRARPVAGLASALCTVDHIVQFLKLARNTAFWPPKLRKCFTNYVKAPAKAVSA